ILRFGEQPQLLGISLAVVENDGALPTAFLVMIEFAQVGHDVLAGAVGGADAFHQGVVGVLLAVLEAFVGSEKHARPLARHPAWPGRSGRIKGVGLHYNAWGRFPLRQNTGNLQKPGAKKREKSSSD